MGGWEALDLIGKVLRNYIAGEWRPSAATHSLPVPNPATEELLARVPLSPAEEVDAAVVAAARAFQAWRETPVVERGRKLMRYKRVLEDHLEELARLTVHEAGKALEEARGDIRRGIEAVEFAAGMPTLMMGRVVEDAARGVDQELFRAPLGVVAGICPFNFPAMFPLWLMSIAVACGNTFVLKPSERCPLSAVRLVELLSEVDLPAGVVNLVHGEKEAVDAILAHPAVRAVSFVGTERVGRYVYSQAAANGKRVQCLVGAKNHLIVMPDAVPKQTVGAILSSAFGNAGQRCLAGSVLVAVGEAGEVILPLLVGEAGCLRVGNGIEPDVRVGALIRREHKERVEAWIEQAVAEGAKLLLDGRRADVPPHGYFVGPTILDGVNPDMAIAQEEIFGPVLVVMRAETLEEAIDLANRSRYGNAAVIFTQSGAAARTFRYRIQAGMLGVNVGVPAPMAFFPFTGWKASFFGDLHATGMDAVEFYTEKKVVTTRWW